MEQQQQQITMSSNTDSSEQQKQRQEINKSSISALPPEVMMEIFSRLPIKSIAYCRSVSKPWLKLSTDPHFTQMHLSKPTPESLLLHIQPSFYHNPPDDPYLVNPPNDLYLLNTHQNVELEAKFNTQFNSTNLQYTIVGSCNGLLCLSMRNDPVYVCSPITGEYLTLPEAQVKPHIPTSSISIVSGFGFDSVTNQYKVMRVFYEHIYDPVVQKLCTKLVGEVFTIGSANWRSLGDVPFELREPSSEAFVNGNLHWMVRIVSSLKASERIASFNIHEEKFVAIPPPPACEPNENGSLPNEYEMHLGVLEGRLCLFDSFPEDHLDIWMMMDYGVKESWSKRYVIEGLINGDMERVFIEPIRILENGEILLVWDCNALYSYDSVQKVHRDLKVHGLPCSFHAVSHVARLDLLMDATRKENHMRGLKENSSCGTWNRTLYPVPSHKPILERKSLQL